MDSLPDTNDLILVGQMSSSLIIEALNRARFGSKIILSAAGWSQIGKVAGILRNLNKIMKPCVQSDPNFITLMFHFLVLVPLRNWKIKSVQPPSTSAYTAERSNMLNFINFFSSLSLLCWLEFSPQMIGGLWPDRPDTEKVSVRHCEADEAGDPVMGGPAGPEGLIAWPFRSIALEVRLEDGPAIENLLKSSLN